MFICIVSDFILQLAQAKMDKNQIIDNIFNDIIGNIKLAYNKPATNSFEIPFESICMLITIAIEIFKKQRMCLRLKSPINIAANLHGHFDDLIKLMTADGGPPVTSYLFLGDYVDRGEKCLETICLLLAYAIKFPNHFWLLRGSNEDACKGSFFKEQCRSRSEEYIWHLVQNAFDYMPVAAIIDDKVFCCHGGASPLLNSIEDIDKLPRPNRVPPEGLMRDLLWAKPNPNVEGFAYIYRKSSYEFGDSGLNEFLLKVNCLWMVRAHNKSGDCFMFHENTENKMMRMVTVFSVLDYKGSLEFHGAVMNLTQTEPLFKYNFYHVTENDVSKTPIITTKLVRDNHYQRRNGFRQRLQSFFFGLIWKEIPTNQDDA